MSSLASRVVSRFIEARGPGRRAPPVKFQPRDMDPQKDYVDITEPDGDGDFSDVTKPGKGNFTDISKVTKEAQLRAVQAIIRKEKGKGYCVKSPSNSDWNGGCYPSKGEAEKRLEQVEYFKHNK